MIDELKQLYTTNNNISIPISYSLLLAPHEEHFSKQQTATIKQILFQYLADCKRPLYCFQDAFNTVLKNLKLCL